MHAQKKKKQDRNDEAEEEEVKGEDSAYAMMALLPLKESKCMHRKRSKTAQMKQQKGSRQRTMLTL